MLSSAKKAIIATADRESAQTIAAILESFGEYRVVATAADGNKALEAIYRLKPDVVVADAILPGCEGVVLAERVMRSVLSNYPAMILLSLFRLSRKDEQRVQDYGGIILSKPCTAADLKAALEATAPERRTIWEVKRQRAAELLNAIGMPEHCGREYLLRAILIGWLDERYLYARTSGVYPLIAAEFGVNRKHVERSIRHVIDHAWQSGAQETQYRLFGDTIDAMRGNPTCGEMIARIADILRSEGYR